MTARYRRIGITWRNVCSLVDYGSELGAYTFTGVGIYIWRLVAMELSRGEAKSPRARKFEP